MTTKQMRTVARNRRPLRIDGSSDQFVKVTGSMRRHLMRRELPKKRPMKNWYWMYGAFLKAKSFDFQRRLHRSCGYCGREARWREEFGIWMEKKACPECIEKFKKWAL